MAGARYDDLGDLLNTTLPDLPRTFSSTLRQTDYPLTRMFFTEFKRKKQGGKWYEKRIRARARTTFQFVNLYEPTGALQEDLVVVQRTDWIHWQEKMPFDDREVDANSGGAQIIEMMEERRDGSYEGIYNGLEDDLSDVPDNSSDRKHLSGLPYWAPTLELNSEDPDGGFNGKTIYFRDGTSSTTRAGVDLSDARNQRARTFVGTYSGYADEPFFDLLRRAITRTNFGTLLQLEGEKPADSSAGGMYLLADHDMNDQLVRRINKGPDDQNGDIERFDQAKFSGVKMVRVPTLSSFAYKPVYGCKRAKTFGIVLKDRWMKELKAINSQSTPETWVVPIVGTCNLTCDDPRSGIFNLHVKRTAA